MGLVDLGGILVAVIAALGAWAAQRSAARASRINTSVSGRLEAEKNAYERARAFDIQTIERQDAEIAELQEANEVLRNELKRVKERLRKLEDNIPTALERLLHERLAELDDPEQ